MWREHVTHDHRAKRFWRVWRYKANFPANKLRYNIWSYTDFIGAELGHGTNGCWVKRVTGPSCLMFPREMSALESDTVRHVYRTLCRVSLGAMRAVPPWQGNTLGGWSWSIDGRWCSWLTRDLWLEMPLIGWTSYVEIQIVIFKPVVLHPESMAMKEFCSSLARFCQWRLHANVYHELFMVAVVWRIWLLSRQGQECSETECLAGGSETNVFLHPLAHGLKLFVLICTLFEVGVHGNLGDLRPQEIFP